MSETINYRDAKEAYNQFKKMVEKQPQWQKLTRKEKRQKLRKTRKEFGLN